jgi:hypothetical protein
VREPQHLPFLQKGQMLWWNLLLVLLVSMVVRAVVMVLVMRLWKLLGQDDQAWVARQQVAV